MNVCTKCKGMLNIFMCLACAFSVALLKMSKQAKPHQLVYNKVRVDVEILAKQGKVLVPL